MTDVLAGTRVMPHLTSTLGTRTREYLDGILGANPGTFDAALNDDWTITRRFAEVEHDHAVGVGQELLEEAKQKHLDEIGRRLGQLGLQMRAKQVTELLKYLTTDQAFAWADVARLLGVSVPAVRKWRLEGGVAPDNHARLADLGAFVKLFTELVPSVKPSVWLSTPLVSGYTVAPRHLYSAQLAASLLDVAQNGSPFLSLLDSWDPLWRDHYDDRGFEVGHGPDGRFLKMK